jgi:uncharacterized membrane protein
VNAAPSPPGSDARGTSSTGLDPRVAATLSYLAWWLTGLLFLVLERKNRYVRFHAVQSLVGLGAVSAVGILLAILSFLTLFVSATVFRVLLALSVGTWMLGVVVSLVCLYKAYAGETWKLPLVGDFAERMAATL